MLPTIEAGEVTTSLGFFQFFIKCIYIYIYTVLQPEAGPPPKKIHLSNLLGAPTEAVNTEATEAIQDFVVTGDFFFQSQFTSTEIGAWSHQLQQSTCLIHVFEMQSQHRSPDIHDVEWKSIWDIEMVESWKDCSNAMIQVGLHLPSGKPYLHWLIAKYGNFEFGDFRVSIAHTPLKFNSSPLKMDGWKTSFLLGPGLCSGNMLVLGRVWLGICIGILFCKMKILGHSKMICICTWSPGFQPIQPHLFIWTVDASSHLKNPPLDGACRNSIGKYHVSYHIVYPIGSKHGIFTHMLLNFYGKRILYGYHKLS